MEQYQTHGEIFGIVPPKYKNETQSYRALNKVIKENGLTFNVSPRPYNPITAPPLLVETIVLLQHDGIILPKLYQ